MGHSLDLLPRETVVLALDDDPTGAQTLQHVREWLDLSPPSIHQGVGTAPERGTVLFLTNTRAMRPADAASTVAEVTRLLWRACRVSGRKPLWVQRADSTLRGHYPLEVDVQASVLAEESGRAPDLHLLVPAFPQAGRVTEDDVHYVTGEDGTRVPVAETEFAQDPAHGYRHSHLPTWVQERSQGRWTRQQVLCLSLRDIREGGASRVAHVLHRARGGQPVVANATCQEDLEVLAAGLREFVAAGGLPLVRCASSFLKALGGFPDAPLVSLREHAIRRDTQGVLILLGSYTRQSTRQLQALMQRFPQAQLVELQGEPADEALSRKVQEALDAGHLAVVATPRTPPEGGEAQARAQGERLVASGIALVRKLARPPAWILGKGGNTAYHLVRHGLGVSRVHALGQVYPGVPLWLPEDGRWPGLPVVVFPGNVGGTEALAQVVEGGLGRSEAEGAPLADAKD